MYLHDAIVKILKNSKIPMSTNDIALKVNQSGIYTKGDKSPVTSSQISARIRKYPHLFKRYHDGSVYKYECN